MSRFENNAFSSIVHTGDLITAATNLIRTVVELPEKTISLMYKWQVSLDSRKALRELTDAQLKDIGLSRAAADREANKIF